MEGYKHMKLGTLIAAGLLVAACGGGGGSDDGGGSTNRSGPSYDGSTSAASITDGQSASDAGEAAGLGASKAKSQYDADQATTTAVLISPDNSREEAAEAAREVITNLPALNVVSGIQIDDNCGGSSGSVDVSIDISTSGDIQTVTQNQNYSGFCSGSTSDGVTLDGNVIYTSKTDTTPGRLTLTEFDYNGLTITENPGGEQETLNGTYTCTYIYANDSTTSPESINCGFSEVFSVNGATYKMENVEVSFNTGDGSYNIDSARVFHPDQGYVDITGSSLTYCDSGYPEGTITITYYPSGGSGPTETASVTFSGCNPTSFTVSYGAGQTVSGTLP